MTLYRRGVKPPSLGRDDPGGEVSPAIFRVTRRIPSAAASAFWFRI